MYIDVYFYKYTVLQPQILGKASGVCNWTTFWSSKRRLSKYLSSFAGLPGFVLRVDPKKVERWFFLAPSSESFPNMVTSRDYTLKSQGQVTSKPPWKQSTNWETSEFCLGEFSMVSATLLGCWILIETTPFSCFGGESHGHSRWFQQRKITSGFREKKGLKQNLPPECCLNHFCKVEVFFFLRSINFKVCVGPIFSIKS